MNGPSSSRAYRMHLYIDSFLFRGYISYARIQFSVLLIAFCCFQIKAVSAQHHALLQSGPMVGASQMKEVKLWVQTTEAADVFIKYWDQENPDEAFFTYTVETGPADGYTAQLIADQVEPGRTYNYALYLNDRLVRRDYLLQFETPPLWYRRSDIPPVIRFTAGSCTFINDSTYDYVGKPYGGNYEIFESLIQERAQFMLWLGDNVYFRESDWTSRSGIYYRYTYARSRPWLQPFLARTAHYAIWDDHDFGPNNSNRAFILKDVALDAFTDFWANPSYGFYQRPGITTSFSWGDVEFFLLDNRYNRTPNERTSTERTMLGEHQFQWLMDALKTSYATFKFVVIGGQILNPVERYETYQNLYPEERNRLIETLQREQIPGVIFLDGDRHHSEISVLTPEDFYPLYDVTVSPLTSRAYDASDEDNPLRIPGSHIGERNYALFEITGEVEKRILHIYFKNAKGDLLWEHHISEEELYLPELRD